MKNLATLSALVLLVLAGCAPLITDVSPTGQPTPIEQVSTAVSTLPAATDTPTAIPTAEPTTEPTPFDSQLLAYVAPSGNVMIRHLPTGDEQPVTSDATGEQVVEGVGMLRYTGLTWSSDGLLLAFQREQGLPISEGLNVTFMIQVYNLQTGEIKTLFENELLVGFDWQPGTHIIAFALGTDPNYWITRGGVDASVAKGIWTIDADSTLNAELVKPERGLHLVRPQWSPDGSVLGFEEIEFMEGRGKFAYFDTSTGKYIPLDQQVGNYDWLPDGQRMVFDTMTYTGSGMERIWVANRDGSGAKRISPHYAEGYAYLPTLSPSGDQVAYLAQFGTYDEPGKSQIKLYVQPLEEVEPRELAEFEMVDNLAWSPDGSYLILTIGPYEARVIVQINLVDGSQTEITAGSSPAMQP